MAVLKLEGLTKTFEGKKGNVNALSDINIEIEEGEIFGIIGMSGAGKSTLVRCINLLEKPTSGSVKFDGKELTTLKKKELAAERTKISMIFQQFNLLMQRTALKNVCFPLELQGVPKKEAEQKGLIQSVTIKNKIFETIFCHIFYFSSDFLLRRFP